MGLHYELETERNVQKAYKFELILINSCYLLSLEEQQGADPRDLLLFATKQFRSSPHLRSPRELSILTQPPPSSSDTRERMEYFQ